MFTLPNGYKHDESEVFNMVFLSYLLADYQENNDDNKSEQPPAM